MPRLSNTDPGKFQWANSVDNGNGIHIEVSELQGILDSTDTANQAMDACEEHRIDASFRKCWINGDFAVVVVVGEFVIAHGQEWVIPVEDLDCKWIS